MLQNRTQHASVVKTCIDQQAQHPILLPWGVAPFACGCSIYLGIACAKPPATLHHASPLELQYQQLCTVASSEPEGPRVPSVLERISCSMLFSSSLVDEKTLLLLWLSQLSGFSSGPPFQIGTSSPPAVKQLGGVHSGMLPKPAAPGQPNPIGLTASSIEKPAAGVASRPGGVPMLPGSGTFCGCNCRPKLLWRWC